MSCKHEQSRSYWVPYDPDDESQGYWDTETISTTEDIDIHRYRCTQCNPVMYYSAASQLYYETGIDSKELFRS